MPMGFETMERRVKLEGYVEAETPLHIGAGQSLGATGSDSPVLLDLAERPFIPGSSLKGALRAQVEALLRGIPPSHGQRAWACDVVAERTCIPKPRWKQPAHDIPAEACCACLLFGGPYVAGKIAIADLALLGEEWDHTLIQVRDGVAIDRDSLTAGNQKKYDFELVPPGTRFGLRVVLDNPEDYEIGLLLRTFDLFNEGFAFLGGKSSRGAGRVRIEPERMTEISPACFLRGEASSHTPVESRERYFEALRQRIESAEG